MDDPHLLAEDGLDGDVDGDEKEEGGGEVQEEAAVEAAGAVPVREDGVNALEVQKELDACGGGKRMIRVCSCAA